MKVSLFPNELTKKENQKYKKMFEVTFSYHKRSLECSLKCDWTSDASFPIYREKAGLDRVSPTAQGFRA